MQPFLTNYLKKLNLNSHHWSHTRKHAPAFQSLVLSKSNRCWVQSLLLTKDTQRLAFLEGIHHPPFRSRDCACGKAASLSRFGTNRFPPLTVNPANQLRSLSLHHTIPKHQHVHVSAEEAVEGVLGGVHDGFVFVEARVEQDGHLGLFVKSAD